MINVLGDSIGAGIVYELSKNELDASDGAPNGGLELPSNEIPLADLEKV